MEDPYNNMMSMSMGKPAQTGEELDDPYSSNLNSTMEGLHKSKKGFNPAEMFGV